MECSPTNLLVATLMFTMVTKGLCDSGSCYIIEGPCSKNNSPSFTIRGASGKSKSYSSIIESDDCDTIADMGDPLKWKCTSEGKTVDCYRCFHPGFLRRAELSGTKILSGGHLFDQTELKAHCKFHAMQVAMYFCTTGTLFLLLINAIERYTKIQIASIFHTGIGVSTTAISSFIIFANCSTNEFI